MKLTRLVAILWIFTAAPAFAAESGGLNELYIYPTFQYFQWEEFHGGQRLLRETGPMFGVGAVVGLESPRLDIGNSLTFRAKAELFGSVVDYDGQTQPPNPLPVKTDVIYFGSKSEIDLGWRYTIGALFLEPFGGAGVRWWLRDLQDST